MAMAVKRHLPIPKLRHQFILSNDGKRWIVTLYRMHDTENEQNHQQCHHKLYTPNTRHINNIQQLAYHDRLSGQSKRHTVEEQMLQNPALNRIESVQTMKRKIDRIAGDLCCEYPEAPTCESEGFRRERSAERKDRCKALVSIWNKFDGLDRSQSDVVWAYVNCLYLCWESEYDRLKTMLQCL
eukprot:794363_1